MFASIQSISLSRGTSIRFPNGFAVASLECGDDIKTVQENLGHATASFTLDVYGHVSQQMRQESARRMEKIIREAS